MATFDTRFTINGLVRTSEPVWDNLERLTEASSCWLTYDTHSGRYGVIINDVSAVVADLTEADIIGSIQIAGSSLTNLYNEIEIEYPKAEIRDQPYYYKLKLPAALRNQYEPDNTLQISSEYINNDIQAQIIADRTLRQSRLDKVATIITDYSWIHLQAGDVITVTSDTYGWISKKWRIMRVREVEGDDGSFRIEFQLLEYDDSVYSDEDITQFLSDGAPGIRSIGAIGKPGKPTVSVANLNSIPTQTVTSTCPAGIVERMQFWAGNVAITGNVANTQFELYGVVASTDAASFTEGANVVYDNSTLPSGTWAWKTRGTNALAVGPFSDPSDTVDYVRDLTPDCVLPGLPVKDITGNIILPIENSSFAGSLVDILEFTGNARSFNMIFTNDSAIMGINSNIANVYNLPTRAQYVTASVGLRGICLESAANEFSTAKGVAIYYNAAVWNQTAYNTGGFQALQWGNNWIWAASYKDNDNNLDEQDAFLNIDSWKSLYVGDAQNLVLAFGFSSTLVPNPGDFQLVTDPITGITARGYQVPFVGYTVIADATGVGSVVYQTPGITAANQLYSGMPNAQVKLVYML